MQRFNTSFTAMLGSLWRNRSFVLTLIKRDVQSRYRGSILGLFWSFIQPLFMLAIYTFVFSVVFKARWNAGSDSKTEFALVLFAGLIIFNLFSECINRAPGLVVSHANYVKKVIFPLEILPCVSLGSALFQVCISLLVWLLFYILCIGVPPLTILLFPVVLLPLLLFTLGLSWLFAALGVYLRDLSQIVGLITTVLLFLSPIFYSIESLPVAYRSILLCNPLTPALVAVRNVLYWGVIPSVTGFLVYSVAASLVAWSGFICFQTTRKGFADVL